MTVFEAIKDAVQRINDWEGRTSRQAFWLIVPVSFAFPFVLYALLYPTGIANGDFMTLFLCFQLPALFAPVMRRLIDAGISHRRPLISFVLAVIGMTILWSGGFVEITNFQTDCLDCSEGELAVSPVPTDLYNVRFRPVATALAVSGVLAAAFFVSLLMQPSAPSNDAPNPEEVTL